MISTLDEDQCFALLESTTVGRVGLVNDGRIEIIPVNYRMHQGHVVFRTRAEGALAGLPQEPDVAFEVDYHDDLSGTGWDVLLGGTVEVMPAEDIAALPAAHPVNPWAGGDRELWLRLVIDRISGRRVRRPSR